MQIAVLNPGGRDREQHFGDGAGTPDDRQHAPVNYHAYAACTRGGFYRDASAIPKDMRAVLVLLRKDLKVVSPLSFEGKPLPEKFVISYSG